MIVEYEVIHDCNIIQNHLNRKNLPCYSSKNLKKEDYLNEKFICDKYKLVNTISNPDATYGKCPKCGAKVMCGYMHIDYKCPECKNMLKW